MARTKDTNHKNGSFRNKNASNPRLIAKSRLKVVETGGISPRDQSAIGNQKFQKFNKLLITKAPFHRLLDGLFMDLFLKKERKATRWKDEAREGLQWATESFIRDLFSDAVETIIHAKRVTPMPKDLHLAVHMRGYDKGILDGWNPGKPKP